ncbi:hypothetical protein KAJ87_04230 [Candidatus Pacearchaeota archaeon]|nr:hypothetical protein [Candidatus Pacearchaeota archaeon]
MEEEKQEFKEKNFTLKDIQRFRQQNQTFQKLDEFRRQNLLQSETFAIFTEYFLSNKFEVKDKFNKKYDCLENKEKEAVDSAINFSQQHGDLATFYASGLARKTTQERVGKLLGEIYGSRLNDVKFALLYGSKKEFSDIDVFVVSDTLKEIKNNWLDVNVIESSEFEKELKLFDVEITHPISVGEFIFGDKNYLLEKRKQLKEQPITKEAIKHNLQEAEKQRRFAFEYPENSSERKIGLSYFLTSKLIAENLKQGKRVFTREKLLNSQSEINIQLKGGRIK